MSGPETASASKAIPVALIDEPERPSRDAIDPERLGALADDIAAQGLLQPIGLRGPGPTGRYAVVWGHRRLLAHRLLHWPTIDARCFAWDMDPLLARASENFNREQLNPVEEARTVAELVARGHPISAIARLLRRSAGWIESRRRLLAAPEDVRQAIAEGRIGLGVAELLGEIDHDEYRASLISEAERSGASTATVGVWLAHYHADRNRIVQNHLTAIEIAQARDQYIVYYACEACRTAVDYRETTAMRFCRSCAEELVRGLQEAASQRTT